MDRLSRPFVACGFGLLLASIGCRATRNEVPPGRPFSKDGQQRRAIEFSSEGHPVNAAAAAPTMPGSNMGGSNLASGIGASSARPDATNFGAPPGSYGPPGTAGLGQPPSLTDPAASRASAMPEAMPPVGLPPLGSPPVGAPPGPDLQVPPPSASRPAPSQVLQPPMDSPGTMGSPDQLPSPN